MASTPNPDQREINRGRVIDEFGVYLEQLIRDEWRNVGRFHGDELNQENYRKAFWRHDAYSQAKRQLDAMLEKTR